MPRQAGLYLRISQDRLGEGLAVDRQREDGRRLIELRDWALVEEFVDNDISAAGNKKRPGFDRMIDAIRSQKIDVVVAWSLDRLTRNRRDQLRLIETCQQYGVNLALVRGSDIDLSSAIGRGVADIMSATARIEIEQKSERQIRANRQAAEQGRMVGGRRAFGYTADGLHLDPVEAPLLRQMYERFLTGAPLVSIARWLDSLGQVTTRGRKWHPATIRVVLANPRNAGKRAMRPLDPRTGRREFWHDDPVADGKWPAVVSEATWRAAVAVLKDPSRRSSPGNQPKYLLSGLARCGFDGCGALMFTSSHHGARTLRCSMRRHISRKAEPIEDWVEEQLMFKLRSDALGLFADPEGEEVDLDAVRAESLVLRARQRELAEDYMRGVVTRDQRDAASEVARVRLGELDALIAAAGRVDITAPLRAADDPEEVWDGYSMDERREVLRQSAVVTVLPGRPGQPGGVRFQEDTVRIEWL